MIIFMIEKDQFKNYYSKLKYQYMNFTLDYVLSNVTETSITYPLDEISRKNIENKRTFISNLIKTKKNEDIKELYQPLDINKCIKQINFLNHYFFIPWFYFYPNFQELKASFFSYIENNASYFESLQVDITSQHFKDISLKNLKTYANPALGKIPLQSFDKTVIKNINEFKNEKNFNDLLGDWFSFFNDHNNNSYNKFKDKFSLVYNETKELGDRNKNKAEYTICFTSEHELFNDLIAKIIAKYKQNSLIQKKLAYLLALDQKQSLYYAQRSLLLNYFKYFDKLSNPINYKQIFKDYNSNTFIALTEKTKNERDTLKKTIDAFDEKVHERVAANAYFNFYYKKYEYNSISSNQLKSYLLIKSYDSSEYFPYFKIKYKNIFKNCGIKEFYHLIYFFINYEELYREKFLKTDMNCLTTIFPLVSIGAIILNDIRRCVHTFKNSNKIAQSESKHSNIITTSGNTSIIDRDNSRYNMIGKASYNIRNYDLTANLNYNTLTENINNLSDLEKVRLRNRYLSDVGLELGNGISGHINAIQQTFLEITRSNKEESKITAVINCSMFSFWSLSYDKTSTAVHSYIEVFESSSFKQDADTLIPFRFELNDIFTYILELYLHEKFNAIDFIAQLKNNIQFQQLNKNDLKAKLYHIS